ncbi:unnamed protein product [Penicillium salamii]|uniref:Uncharacterized protein n=1 Tax=Penicillium salamii TaxID=1612424 RepID=A0A9W4NWN6_9EURO|nr:unnamed protein product [Penicillium salamii]CAG8336007.1 unnamed protein product [Penicillium salamii]CAG8338749.1 unnamed protein product [Penicillium salamii]CAG8387684.1 unnamed protein product [Penicillium salamii]CAG8395632.1 unnamed protein product [Penicillium salamii]
MVKREKKQKSQTPLDRLPIERRLAILKFNVEDCKDAIHGRRVPSTFGDRVHQLCIIRGIRYHHGFAQELRGATPEFTRALNAREIMSGIIPTVSKPDEAPYCIWHPDVPSEDTLRALVQRYPDMLYNAARACAVAGYIDLYKELDPLPEVHVAEDAGYASFHKSNRGSQEIYEHILSQPVKYAIMNDYKRTVDVAGRRIAVLNGDTAVCSSLEARYKYSTAGEMCLTERPWVSKSAYFNITEDFGIDDHDCEAPKTPNDDVELLYSPLPADLPLVNKDSLIYLAAYTGDIDRYARLRRPKMLDSEFDIVIRGIYHNAFFAKWWSTQIPEQPQGASEAIIRRAINARRIMSNDLSWVTADIPPSLLPEMIWFPAVATALTYSKLPYMEPRMYRACLRACIAANYASTWDDLLLAPPENVFWFQSPRRPDEPEDPKLWRISRIIAGDFWKEAEQSRNPYFLQEMSTAVPKRPEDSNRDAHWSYHFWADSLYFPHVTPLLCTDEPVQAFSGEGPYDGRDGGIGDADCAVFAMDSIGREILGEEKEKQESSCFPLEKIFDLIEAKQKAHDG